MYEEILIKVGLTQDQAKIYEVLLKKGVMPASKAALNAGLKRSLGYKVLEQLVSLGLVEKIDKKVALYIPVHPSKIKELIQKKDSELKIIEASLSGALGLMVSDYNLNSGKPNVRFFEGEDGMKKVLEDSLTAKEVIFSYADAEAVEKYIFDINKKYKADRIKYNIKKKILLLDSEFGRNFIRDYDKAVTELKIMPSAPDAFHTVMQIYDNKVSYITLSDVEMIGVIIEDPYIYKMHKQVFQYMWDIAPTTFYK